MKLLQAYVSLVGLARCIVMARQWAGIERAMNFANDNPAFRPQVESLLNTYFAFIDEMVAELERRRVTRIVSLED